MDRVTADLLRVLAMVAVVLIHAADAWSTVTGWPQGVRQWALLITDQLGRFCVPLFVLLSGYALGKRHGDGPLPYGDFLRRRCTRIGVPYLAWSLANVAAMTVLIHLGTPSWSDSLRGALHARAEEGTLAAALRALLTGGADYHLYFLPIVLQLYLVFPLLRLWRCTPASLAVVIGAQLALFAWAEATLWSPGLWFPPLWAVFPGWWLGLFLCGMWLAQHDATLAARVGALPAAVVAALIGVALLLPLADVLALSARGARPEYAGGFFRPAVAAAVAGLVLLALRIDARLAAASPRLLAWITAVAAASFATYLAHTWVLRGLEPTGLKAHAWWAWLPLALVASAAVGALVHAAARRWRAVGWLVGA